MQACIIVERSPDLIISFELTLKGRGYIVSKSK
jgi:hypothetical protein